MSLGRGIFCFCFCLFFNTKSLAQKYDIGASLGAAGYMGDLNPKNPFLFSRGGGGISLRKNFDPNYSLKLNFVQLLVHADEAKFGTDEMRQQNLKFTSWITEVSLQFEFNFFKFNPFDSRASYTPYLSAGVGGFHFNPYTFYNGAKVFLKDVGTEGQILTGRNRLYNYPSPYPLNSFCFPLGIGFKMHLKGNLSVTAEYGYRFTLTNYLDDVGGLYPATDLNVLPDINGFTPTLVGLPTYYDALSDRSGGKYRVSAQRGNAQRFDKYFYGQIALIYTFKSLECPSFNIK